MTISTPNRTIRVSQGAAEYVTGRVQELEGADLTDATFEVGLGSHDQAPTVWSEPADLRLEDDGSVAFVSMLVDDSVAPRARGWLWVRVTDVPEVMPRRCDGGFVEIV
jgi:hypothetical protein